MARIDIRDVAKGLKRGLGIASQVEGLRGQRQRRASLSESAAIRKEEVGIRREELAGRREERAEKKIDRSRKLLRQEIGDSLNRFGQAYTFGSLGDNQAALDLINQDRAEGDKVVEASVDDAGAWSLKTEDGTEQTIPFKTIARVIPGFRDKVLQATPEQKALTAAQAAELKGLRARLVNENKVLSSFIETGVPESDPRIKKQRDKILAIEESLPEQVLLSIQLEEIEKKALAEAGKTPKAGSEKPNPIGQIISSVFGFAKKGTKRVLGVVQERAAEQGRRAGLPPARKRTGGLPTGTAATQTLAEQAGFGPEPTKAEVLIAARDGDITREQAIAIAQEQGFQ